MTTSIEVVPSGAALGAAIANVDLSRPLPEDTVREIRAAWLTHQVVFFPDQPMTHEDLERFTGYIGSFGDDPYIQSIDGHRHILEVRREADEKATVFGAAWHSDWSFQETPPAATILHAKVVPPVGGETWFASGYSAYDALPDDVKQRLEGLEGIHSAVGPYSPEGFYANEGERRSMTILPNPEARARRLHPVVRTHAESGRRTLFVNRVYTIAIEGLDAEESRELLDYLLDHAESEAFVYRHRWQANMLTMWDNRCVQHNARGGYDGHRRILHRTTVAGEAPV